MDIKKVSLSELIRIAKENQDKVVTADSIDEYDEVTSFILTCKLKEGGNTILSSVIYSAYCNWSLSPLSKSSFFMRFKKVFVPVGTGAKQHFLLNHKAGQLLNLVENKKIKYESTK